MPNCIFQLINPEHKAQSPQAPALPCFHSGAQDSTGPSPLETELPIVPAGPACLFSPFEHFSHTVGKPGRALLPPDDTPSRG